MFAWNSRVEELSRYLEIISRESCLDREQMYQLTQLLKKTPMSVIMKTRDIIAAMKKEQ
jgi:hypothetical protein